MTNLQTILLGRDWLGRDALRKALRHQKQMGGSLALCLLEVGAISEDRLLRALSERYGVPFAEVDALRTSSPEVTALLPERLARRAKAVPFHLAGTALHVALANPLDLAAQDEIAFACGKRLHVHVSHEARIAEALDRFYGEEPSSRIAALIDKLNRSRYLWRAREEDREAASRESVPAGMWDEGEPLEAPELPDPVPELFPEKSSPRPEAPTRPQPGESQPEESESRSPARAAKPPSSVPPRSAPPRSIQLSPEERRKLYGGGPGQEPTAGRAASAAESAAGSAAGPAAGSAAGSLSAEPFAAAFERLATVQNRNEVGAILLDLLASQFRRSLLFVVRGGRLEGWRGRGEGVDTQALEQLSLSPDQPSVFLNLVQGSPFHLGPLPDFPAHQELARVWGGGPLPPGCLVMPVRLHDRLVLALYGDRVNEPVGGVALHRFQELAVRTVSALERCIMLKKQRTSGVARS